MLSYLIVPIVSCKRIYSTPCRMLLTKLKNPGMISKIIRQHRRTTKIRCGCDSLLSSLDMEASESLTICLNLAIAVGNRWWQVRLRLFAPGMAAAHALVARCITHFGW